MASGGTSAPARGRREETWTGRAHRRQERRPRAGVGALNVATELRVLEPCLQRCWLCKEFDDEDDPHPIVPGTTVGHCAKSRLPWHARHICVPCQAELDAILGWADGAGPTSASAGAAAGGGEAGDGEQGHSRARDGVR